MLDIICTVLILLSVFLSGLFLGFLLWYKQRTDLVSMSTVRKVHEDFLDEQEKAIGKVISEEKTEVAREIFEEIEKEGAIFEGAHETTCYFPNGFFAKLKKKYTEG